MTREDRDVARASYDIDGFALPRHTIIGGGRRLHLHFLRQRPARRRGAVHVDVGGDLPASDEAWPSRETPAAHHAAVAHRHLQAAFFSDRGDPDEAEGHVAAVLEHGRLAPQQTTTAQTRSHGGPPNPPAQ